jgi:hypothetical protein
MRRLLPMALLILSSCLWRRVAAPGANDPASQTMSGSGPLTPAVGITIDTSAESLCGPDDTDPQHNCPAQAGPAQR